MIPEKILIVDDDPNIIQALKRQLRTQFTIDGAAGGEQGLALLRQSGPYAVVVSDMRMPGMDGVTFLREVQTAAPQAVRIMLTGNADQSTATRAVNETNIFRLLAKPCATEDFVKALLDALHQYRLVTAERELLEHTLSGSVKLLTDILALLDPTSFGKLSALRYPIREICTVLGVGSSWNIEIAAMLADIGAVTLPGSVEAKRLNGEPLTNAEHSMIEQLPENGARLLRNIPRLSEVSEIVLYQNKNYNGSGFPNDSISRNEIPIGARMLRILKDLVSRETPKQSKGDVLRSMALERGKYDPELLELISTYYADLEHHHQTQTTIIELKVLDLKPGHITVDSIETTEGLLVVGTGALLNEALIERIRNFAQFSGIREPLKVVVTETIAE